VKSDKQIQAAFSFTFQLKYGLAMVIGSILTSLTLYFSLDRGLEGGYFQSLVTLSDLEKSIPYYLIGTFIIQLLLIFCITFIIHLFVSHKIAGPVYRYELSVTSLLKNDLRIAVRTRKGDQLKPMVESLNTFAAATAQTVEKLKELGEQLDEELAQNKPDLASIRRRISLIQPRLGNRGSGATGGPAMRSLLLGILSAAIILTGVVISQSRENDPHDFSGQCERCHLVSPQKGQKGIFVQDIDHLCKSCHQVVKGNSHPSEVVPSMPIPKSFDLDWQGRMTCTTCHDPHMEADDEDADDHSKLFMLRAGIRGREFCQLCHKDLLKNRHLTSTSIAHSKSWTPPAREKLNNGLDSVSLDCLNCHEGTVGPVATYRRADEPALSFQGMSFSHPIGMDYARAAIGNRELRPVDDLSPMISLYEGKVGCASCHNPFSHEKVMLVFDNGRSALCLECHLK